MTYVVNIATPNTQETTKALIEYVTLLGNKVKVNNAYWLVKLAFEEGSFLMRPGFKFIFWFEEFELAVNFACEFDGIIQEENK